MAGPGPRREGGAGILVIAADDLRADDLLGQSTSHRLQAQPRCYRY